ncbi:MAG: redoxin domain-containing protein [Candidatus Lokiarchaeota archaeon]|nr:redoxin domain-containing protein [Candidatus Lokiarchaeota archaeon]
MAKTLRVGELSPDLKATPVNMTAEFDLKKAITEKPVVLVFSRYFGCPVCQSDFDKLLNMKNKIQAKAHLVYITQSSPDNVRKFLAGKEGVDFPVISDPTPPYPLYNAFHIGNINLLTIAKMGGALIGGKYKHGEYEGNEKQSPADFAVGKDGKLVHVNYSLLNPARLLEIIDAL